MRFKLLLFTVLLTFSYLIYSGFSSGDESPRWNPDPMTRINSGNVFQEYTPLPQQDYINPVVNEPAFFNTPMGVLVVNSAFRVHPISAGHQTEVPITRHPTNPLIMFGSANTSRGGNFSTGWYVTTDGGTSWFGNDTLFSSAGTPVFNFGDPGPLIDRNGRFINSYITLSGQIGASWSTNNGVNWSTTVALPGSTSSSDKNLSATDDAPSSAFYGRSYTFYTEFSGALVNRIAGSYTTNGGVNWSTVAAVSPLAVSGSNYFHQGADVKCGPNGEVYVVWTCADADISPYTEDSLGFAKSTNGGVSWTIATNHAANVNGNRTFNMLNGIRVAGFPRIDVDRTCGPRAGWIYVVVGEKNPGVAGDVSDIVLYRSTNGGTSWLPGVRVNQDAFGNGKKQYMSAIRVDESGGVNVVYYDTRNSPSNDSSEVYLSRSVDGGATFTDIKVGNKFRHGPTGIAGVNTQYAGDYIGITSALIEGNPVNGNQRIWPYWMSNASGVYNAWTAKVEVTPTNPCPGCQDFSSSAFTPDYYSLLYTGTQYWSRAPQSAYGAGTGSAMFNFYNATAGNDQSLITDFQAVPSGYYVTFDEAYAPYSPSFGPDTLIVQSSTNGGTSYSTLAILLGKGDGSGDLNTAPATTSSYVPANNQWASKIYNLPLGTNRIRMRAKSGFGNNLYLDNICIQALTPAVTNSICCVPEGFYRATPFPQAIPDTVRAYLYRTDFPNIAVDSSVSYLLAGGCLSGPVFPKALNGNYYLALRHRNTMKTWSAAGGFAYVRGSSFSRDFINNLAQTYLNSEKLIDPQPFYGMYSGDINQDETIDGSDLSLADNGAFSSISGYVREDVNGDNFVDASDVSIVDNNVGVSMVGPPGAAPSFNPNEIDISPEFKTDSERMKFESAKEKIEKWNSDAKEKLALEKQQKDLLNEKYNFSKRIPSDGVMENKDKPKSNSGFGSH
ncbi:MAG: hypothetical protein JST15_05255 [Bacteroidetes bacterium]|nr:hypothetical protein [Bacteroidota bacterium]